jgi:hypothetical protein
MAEISVIQRRRNEVVVSLLHAVAAAGPAALLQLLLQLLLLLLQANPSITLRVTTDMHTHLEGLAAASAVHRVQRFLPVAVAVHVDAKQAAGLAIWRC